MKILDTNHLEITSSSKLYTHAACWLYVAGISIGCANPAGAADVNSSGKSIAAVPSAALAIPHAVQPTASANKSPAVTQSALRKKALTAYPRTHFEKAQFYKRKGDKGRALVELLKATQQNPHLVRAFYEQALIFQERGYLKLAQSSLEQALAVKPDYRDARILLATLQIQQGNVGAAMTQLGKSLGLDIAQNKAAQKGEQTNNETDSEAGIPLPTVLQSLHLPLPEPKPAETEQEEIASSSLGKLLKPAVSEEESRSKKTRKAKPQKKAKPKKRFWNKLFTDEQQQNQTEKSEAKVAAEPVSEPISKKDAVVATAESKSDWNFPSSADGIAKQPLPPTTAAEAQKNAAFSVPQLPTKSKSLLTPLQTAAATAKQTAARQDKEESDKPKLAPNSDEPWAVRLRYLAEHGTNTLKDGEAFMFSEESGEATLFLADGKTVRRQIYLPRDAKEVVRERRPELLLPDDIMYNLSLLAKLMPKASEQLAQQAEAQTATQTTTTSTRPSTSAPKFNADEFMNKSQSMWGWLKNSLKF